MELSISVEVWGRSLVLVRPRSEVVHLWSDDTAYVPSLLVLVLYFTTTHLLLQLFLKEVDFELQFLLNLLALGLVFNAKIRLFLEFFFVLTLQGPDLFFFGPDYLTH